MKRDIENIIRDNRQAFDAEQLPEGYLSDFEKRLTRPKRHLIYYIASLVAVAAAFTLVIILRTPEVANQSIFPDNGFTAEVIELQMYYDNQHKQTIAIIEKLLETAPQEVQIEIRSQLAQMVVDDTEFRRGLQDEPNAEKYIASAVNFNKLRQVSLDNIQQILTQK